jgi:hypothetical protein
MPIDTGERKAELERAVDGAQNRHRRGHDLRPDAVALHHGDAHRGGLCCRIGRHRSLIGVSLATPWLVDDGSQG